MSRTAKLHVMEVAELGSPVGSATPKVSGDPGTEGGVWYTGVLYVGEGGEVAVGGVREGGVELAPEDEK